MSKFTKYDVSLKPLYFNVHLTLAQFTPCCQIRPWQSNQQNIYVGGKVSTNLKNRWNHTIISTASGVHDEINT
jgi:hypothetical protein